jgi:CTP:molybdopterin cytidylyltransferase MocA
MSRPADIMIALLGAGRASRFGADKLSQPCAGKPLGRWALEAALGTDRPVVWIAGAQVPDFVDCEVIRNPDAERGLATSVACAARAAQAREASGLLILLADMPTMTCGVLIQLIGAGACPAACRYPQGHPGVPALFPPEMFGRLSNLTGDQGAGAVLRGLPGLTLTDCRAEDLLDVDTPQALAAAEQVLLARR